MTSTTSARSETQIQEIKEVAIAIAIEKLDPRRITEVFIKANKESRWQRDSGGLLFSGTFTYPAFEGDKQTQAQQAIANSQSDWQEFNQIVDRVFLNKDNSLLQRVMFE